MSSTAENPANFPTMIIPRGTEIKINEKGQLSIKTPGNLVIQNSGSYSELESSSGSIRIEENVVVEAISVKAAQACFIQGTLTAWKVRAKKIALEDRAKAYIMLQESEQLEISKSSRLVGNFTNEKEIYLLLGRFSAQLKELPGTLDMSSVAPMSQVEQPAQADSYYELEPDRSQQNIPEPLRQAVELLEPELGRPELSAGAGEALRELLFSLRERNLQRAGLIYRDVFAELGRPTRVTQQAYDLIDTYFLQSP